ncbi:MAG: SDR family NAD(P)-dependent oxidoreductase [Desulfobacter sp.]|nr:MAG: SDR family NAD(P)-dependent oxidoreductase [Desulfobacter sp.]
MALNLESIGKKIGPHTRDYTWNDVVLYAMGVGAGFSDLEYCYEKDLKVIPSFSFASIADFGFLSSIAQSANLNLAGILHGEQELIFHNPIPVEGTLTTEGKITHMYDKGDKGALVVAEFDTFHSNGQKLFTSIATIFSRLDGNFGGPGAPAAEVVFPDREPDFVVDGRPTENQPLLYRLSGDLFQLHADPDFAKASGFEKPIMHGLCTHGYACRALVGSLIPGAPEQARRMGCRFSKTLYPGEPIETHIWKGEEGRALWKTINKETREEIITNGIFEYGDARNEYIRFDDRVAVVTGAGAGLGRVYALELARRGAKVVVNDYGCARDGSGSGSASPADDVVAEIRAAGGEAVANYDNVATAEGGKGIVASALNAFGTIDVLINNAGILRDKSFVKMTQDNWQAVMDVHLNGAFHVTRPAFEIMKEKGYGRIVFTASAAGLYGNFGQTNYSAAKLALAGLMNSLKLEGTKYDIKVNTVAPLAASRLTEDVMPEEMFAKLKPEFVSPFTVLLASEDCPVTGNIYNVGAGCFNRAAVVTGPGAVVGNGRDIPAPEEVIQQLDGILSMEGAKPLGHLNEMIGEVMARFAPAK